jgi:hypothetical protein
VPHFLRVYMLPLYYDCVLHFGEEIWMYV